MRWVCRSAQKRASAHKLAFSIRLSPLNGPLQITSRIRRADAPSQREKVCAPYSPAFTRVLPNLHRTSRVHTPAFCAAFMPSHSGFSDFRLCTHVACHARNARLARGAAHDPSVQTT